MLITPFAHAEEPAPSADSSAEEAPEDAAEVTNGLRDEVNADLVQIRQAAAERDQELTETVRKITEDLQGEVVCLFDEFVKIIEQAVIRKTF